VVCYRPDPLEPQLGWRAAHELTGIVLVHLLLLLAIVQLDCRRFIATAHLQKVYVLSQLESLKGMLLHV
jgi:hypothetical protein